MSRLQKKCTIVSAGLHLLLGLVLLVGPAFLGSKDRTDDLEPINFVPWQLVDSPFSKEGGSQAAQQQQPQPEPPKPPQPQVVAQPPPPQKSEPEIKKPDPVVKTPDPTPDKTPTKPQPDISKKIVVRNPTPQTDPRTREQAQADARRREAARQIATAANGIRNNVSASTDIHYVPGSGSGESYANYAQYVKYIYEREWQTPDDAANDEAVTKVTVTIGRSGTVLSWDILQNSGDPLVDRSVRRTLERVTFIAPFPAGSTDAERTFKINFNLKAKRLLG